MNSTDIKLDFDNLSRKQLLRLVEKRWRFLFCYQWPKFGRLRVVFVDIRKTTHGYHALIRVRNRIPDLSLNFLQLALGSDFRRECFNLRRISLKQMKVWNILYQYKLDAQEKIVSHESADWRDSKRILGMIRRFQKRRRKNK